MAQPVKELFQPIWASVQLLSITTASATVSTSLPTCGSVRIASGGAPLYFNFTGSASAAAGVGTALLPANSSIVLETGGGHTISFACPTSANPMQVSVMPYAAG